MEYNKRISAIAPGDEVEGYYILKSANPKVAANGKPAHCRTRPAP